MTLQATLVTDEADELQGVMQPRDIEGKVAFTDELHSCYTQRPLVLPESVSDINETSKNKAKESTKRIRVEEEQDTGPRWNKQSKRNKRLTDKETKATESWQEICLHLGRKRRFISQRP